MLKDSPLGQSTVYIETYTPSLLYPIPRTLSRDKLNISEQVPFSGADIWSAYEISWLNPKGKPVIALADFIISADSINIIESKSFKLYLNSFNQTKFSSFEEARKTIENDVKQAIQGDVTVKLYPCQDCNKELTEFSGTCLDHLDIETDCYKVNKSFLKSDSSLIVEETLYSDLLKSNCLATGQPDWGSLLIRYIGPQINHEDLLKYIISFRSHSGFAEHCVEEIFHDIMKYCKPEKLTVYARYTRRGGLDINPFRSNFEEAPFNFRQIRQ